MPKRRFPDWQRRHDAILRLTLEQPFLKRYEIAARTGYSPSHVRIGTLPPRYGKSISSPPFLLPNAPQTP